MFTVCMYSFIIIVVIIFKILKFFFENVISFVCPTYWKKIKFFFLSLRLSFKNAPKLLGNCRYVHLCI